MEFGRHEHREYHLGVLHLLAPTDRRASELFSRNDTQQDDC